MGGPMLSGFVCAFHPASPSVQIWISTCSQRTLLRDLIDYSIFHWIVKMIGKIERICPKLAKIKKKSKNGHGWLKIEVWIT